jgi:large subunit ribosomal protein L31
LYFKNIVYFCKPESGTKQEKAMKKDIHPDKYRLVVFKDMSNGYTFITKSTATTKETIKMDDGKEYPLVKLEISNTSHPFYTGKMKLVDTAGRVDKFNTRYKEHMDKKKKK